MALAAFCLPVLLLLLPAVASVPAEELSAATTRADRPVPLLAEGIGTGIRAAWSAATKDYDLKLAFAITPHHALAAYATVRILDERGNEVLSADNVGPWFFTNLPNGIYRVTAKAYGRAIEQTVEVANGKQTELSFYW